MAELVRLSDVRIRRSRRQAVVYFNRAELNQLIAVYSRRVVSGDWKAYAIDHREGAALFSVFQHAYAKPLYSIVKLGGGAKRGQWLIVSDGQKLRQSATLAEALALFDRKLRLVSP